MANKSVDNPPNKLLKPVIDFTDVSGINNRRIINGSIFSTDNLSDIKSATDKINK